MSTPADWATRMEIAKGIARGLTRLHDYTSIIHGNLTASNILLDEKSHPKIAAYGFFRLMTPAGNSKVLQVARELGCCAPELSNLMEASAKSDVYSMGVIILELLTGKLPSSMDLPRWVERKEWSEMLDLEQMILGRDELNATLMLALQCVDPSPLLRPRASEVLWQLEKIRPGPKNAIRPREDDLSLSVRINNRVQMEPEQIFPQLEGNPLPEPENLEVVQLQPLEHIRLDGHVEEQSSSEWSKQPAEFFLQESHTVDHSSHGLPRSISFHSLNEITDSFSEERKLGSGAFGKVYMGVHKNGEKIAVKMLRDMPGLEEEQFLNEFNSLARLQHPNIVRLVGYCHEIQKTCLNYNGRLIFAERIHRALCFEYMHHGSLDKYISDEYHGLNWNTRYTLIKGICKGLKYLHEELESPMYHFDLKPANILLDQNMLPKIADFGLSRFFGGEHTQITKSSIGTIGYLPPEYIDGNIISDKFDIFSLGVVIMKILTGPTGYNRSTEMSHQEFVELAHENWRKRLQATAADLFESYSKQVKICVEIALNSVVADRHKRPRIGDIVKILDDTETDSQIHTISTQIME